MGLPFFVSFPAYDEKMILQCFELFSELDV